MKKCPYCAEEIQDEAIKCRYCHSDLSPAKLPKDVELNQNKLETKGPPIEVSKITKQPPPRSSPQQSKTDLQVKKKSTKLITILILLIITVICVKVGSDFVMELGKENNQRSVDNLKGNNKQSAEILDAKKILLKKITMLDSNWQFSHEKEIEGEQMLVAAQNPINPKLRPIWLIKKGAIYSINGTATMLTNDFQLSYDFTPSDAMEIMEGRRVYKHTDSRNTWNSIQQAIDVLKVYNFITDEEGIIVKRFDDYLDDLKNSDSEEAVKKWARKQNITVDRLYYIQSMRYGHRSIADIEKNGFVRVGEKVIIKKFGQPTAELITKFDVSYQKGVSSVLIQVRTDLPDGSPLMISINKAGLKGDDTWIGNERKTIVRNGKAEVTIPLTTHKGKALKGGRYDIEIFFNSYWSTEDKDIDPHVKAVVGEFGENLRTNYLDIFEQKNKQYRTIDFKKKNAFAVQ